jgi:hypothetical protein
LYSRRGRGFSFLELGHWGLWRRLVQVFVSQLVGCDGVVNPVRDHLHNCLVVLKLGVPGVQDDVDGGASPLLGHDDASVSCEQGGDTSGFCLVLELNVAL